MGYDNLIRNLILSSWNKSYNLIDLERREAANAITDLLARAEAAEARVHELETLHRTEMCVADQLRKPAGGGVWMTREEAIERVTRDLMSAGGNLQTATHLGAPAQYIETIKRETEYLERVALLVRRYWVEVEEMRT